MDRKLNGHAANGTRVASHPTGDAPHEPDEQEGEDQTEAPEEVTPAEPPPREVPPPPPVIAELATSCVRYVQRALGVELDYTLETLPLLDHYLADAERTVLAKAEDDLKAALATLPLIVHTAGAYFGEVVRRRYPSWWRAEGSDPMSYRIELETAYLAFSPMLFIYEGLAHGLAIQGDQGLMEAAQIEMDEEDEKAAVERLAELAVSEEEYYAPSTRLEAIDVCVDTIRSRRMAEGDPAEMALTPEDYET